MSRRRAVALAVEHVAALGRIRTVPGLEICDATADGRIWIAGHEGDEATCWTRRIPLGEVFVVQDDARVRRPRERVPCGTLPRGPWVPATRWLAVDLPPSALAGVTHGAAMLHLVRCDADAPDAHEPRDGTSVVRAATPTTEATVLCTDLVTFAAYVSTAPLVRLGRVLHAVSEDGRVVVRGAPLPPLPGARCVEHAGIAVPVGWSWRPAIEPEIVRTVFGTGLRDLVLWTADDAAECLRAEDFVPTTRASVRAAVAGRDVR